MRMTELVEGDGLTLPADYVIFAVGQKPEDTSDMGLELIHGSYLVTDGDHRTSEEGIFAAGDVVTGTKSVISAIEGGREAAQAIDRYLDGDGDISEVLLDLEVPDQRIGKPGEYFYDAPLKPKIASAAERRNNFGQYECPFTESEAEREAARCLQCDLRLTLERPKLWNEYPQRSATR